jgi:hypothetical protein
MSEEQKKKLERTIDILITEDADFPLNVPVYEQFINLS